MVELRTTGIARHTSFRSVEIEDADFIYALRSDSGRTAHLSAVEGDVNDQKDWLKNYKERERKGEEYYWILLDSDGRKLGLVRIYDFQENSFVPGSWILIEDAPAYAAVEAALMMYDVAFFQLGFKSARIDVRRDNTKVCKFHLRLGAHMVDEDALNNYYIYTKESYESICVRYRRYFAVGKY
jgi:RimJ/RimL family protein N-acetyltransferase